MEAEDYQRLLDRFCRWATADPRVVGLVAVGSTAGQDRQPDQWSDHDLVVVTEPGQAATVRDDVSWIPDGESVAVRFAEPDHGLNIVYTDGHLLELAICDVDDLGWFPRTPHAVLVGGASLQQQLAATAGRPGQRTRSESDATPLLHRFVKAILIGTNRLERGEILSAHQHIAGTALPLLLELVASRVPPAAEGVLDPLDPTRRFEAVYPAVAERLHHGLAGGLDGLRAALVAVAEEHLRSLDPGPERALRTLVRPPSGPA